MCNSIQECLHVQLNFSGTTVMCNVVALACYNNRVLCSDLDSLCRYSIYFLFTSCGHIGIMQCVTICYVLVHYPMYMFNKARHGHYEN